MTYKKERHPGTWIPSSYFAMGLPFVAIAQASALMFKNLGISDTQIALWTSIIMVPWTIKPLWSPFMEIFKSKKYFVVATQIVTAISFALVALSLNIPNFFQYAIAFLAVTAISGSVHDVACDGVYLTSLSQKLQAKYIGWQGAAYNIAKVVSGGAFVYIAGVLEKAHGPKTAWIIVMLCYGVIMGLLGVYHIFMLPGTSQEEEKTETPTLKQGFVTLGDVIKTFFEKKFIFAYIGFIVLYRFAEGFAIKIAPLFFKAAVADGGLGLETEQIGVVYGVFGSAAFVVGSLLGGEYIAKKGLRNCILTLALAFNIPFVMFALLAFFQPDNIYIIGTAVVLEYLGYGFGFVGLMLFMMQQVAPGKYKMAHYAFASGIMNLGFMIPSMMSGYFSDWLGYQMFFAWVLLATIPAILAAKFVPFKYDDDGNEIETKS